MSQPNADIEEDLSALLDGELSPAEQAALEARLSEDPALQAQYDELAEARAFFVQHGPVAAPADLLGDVLAAAEAIDREQGTVVQLPFWQKPLGVPLAGWAVAAAAVLVVYVALPSFDGGAPVETSPAARAPSDYDEVASWSAPKKAPVVAKGSSFDAADAEPEVDDAAGSASNDAVAVVEKPELAKKSEVKPGRVDDLKAPVAYGMTESKPSTEAIVGDAAPTRDGVSSKRLIPAEPPKEQLEGGFAQVPYQYMLFTDDDEALAQLNAIAGRFRGEVGGPNDQPLQLEELASGSEATVIVKIPAHALQDFGRALEGLGNVYPTRDGRVFAGDPVEVRVQVKLAAGSGQADDTPPNAVRQKQAIEADVMMEDVEQ